MNETPALAWSGSFQAMAPNPDIGSLNLRGDKITLPQSALEQLLAASTSTQPRGSSLSAFDPSNPYAISSSAFRDNAQQLPNPLMFRLVNPANNNVVFAGIREFSAPEGSIGLSPFLLEALGVEGDNDKVLQSSSYPSITVQAKQLPKGTYARLRPLEAGYNPDDWRPLLERQLRLNFTTLTRNTMLSVSGVQGEQYNFLLDKISPEGDGICVVDTDIEVDIEALNEEQARETMRRIMSQAQPGEPSGSSKGGEIDIWKAVDGRVLPGEYVDYILPSWNRGQTLDITLKTSENEDVLDIFVTPKSSRQRSLPRKAVHVFGNFAPAHHGSKSITISPTNVELEGAESILISVHAYRNSGTPGEAPDPFHFTLRASAKDESEAGQNGIASQARAAEPTADEEQCQNCLQWIPKRTMVLHENFCRRNNLSCPKCRLVFKRGSVEWENHWHCDLDSEYGNSAAGKQKHDDVFHHHQTCPSCEFTTNSLPDLARHQTSVCPGKLILCRFCHLEVPQEGDPFDPSPEVVMSGMTAHELSDGARTTECHLCDKIIRMRDMETHLKHHELDKVSRPKPAICRNLNCGRTLHGVGPKGQIGSGTAQGQGPGNDLGLCSLCFGPLYVSMHDPEGKALRRRIERRYLGQLMTGCGKAHCGNEWCKTGRANTELPPKGSDAKTALQEVKPLLAMVSNHDDPFYFCTDESSQTQRKMAEMMAAENIWDLQWCIAAAEAEKSNPEKMRDWLQAWAPSR
jgi:hypothetical protein